jgi:hypothetical protein
MPACGGQTPCPIRCGGGIPRLTRIVESLQKARGPLYSTNTATAVGVENNAIARTLDRDSYGQNERMANSFLPSKATDLGGRGTLRRWEAIFGITPSPSSDEPTRRAAVTAAWQKAISSNNASGLNDTISGALGPLFVAVRYTDPSTPAVSWWPGNPNPDEDPSIPTPWYSTIRHVEIQVTQPSNYSEADFLTAVSAATVNLDGLLPADVTFDWFTQDAGSGFILDTNENLLREAFDV